MAKKPDRVVYRRNKNALKISSIKNIVFEIKFLTVFI